MTKPEAIELAKEQSRDGCVQHVNYQTRCDSYIVSDWYNCDSTVESYTNGELNY